MGAVAYVGLAVVLLVVGFLSLFSIGVPLFMTGAGMLVAMPWRRRPEVLVPSVIAPWAFTLGYVLLAPLGCTSTSTAAPGDVLVREVTRCEGVFLEYVGGTAYSPPLWPAVASGLALGAIAWLLLRRAIARRG